MLFRSGSPVEEELERVKEGKMGGGRPESVGEEDERVGGEAARGFSENRVEGKGTYEVRGVGEALLDYQVREVESTSPLIMREESSGLVGSDTDGEGPGRVDGRRGGVGVVGERLAEGGNGVTEDAQERV